MAILPIGGRVQLALTRRGFHGNGKRLSAAEPTVTERANAAWRRINLVGLDRAYGGAVGSVSFSAARRQAQRAAHRAASRSHGIVIAPRAHCVAPEAVCEARSRAVCRARRTPTPACVRNQALHGMLGCPCRSRRPPATGGCDGGEGRPICDPLPQHMPAPDLAMRAACDVEGGHAPHDVAENKSVTSVPMIVSIGGRRGGESPGNPHASRVSARNAMNASLATGWGGQENESVNAGDAPCCLSGEPAAHPMRARVIAARAGFDSAGRCTKPVVLREYGLRQWAHLNGAPRTRASSRYALDKPQLEHAV